MGTAVNWNPSTPEEMKLVVEAALKIGEPYMQERVEEAMRYYDLYYLRLDTNFENPYEINVRLGKAHSYIEMAAARTVKNLYGDTPYFPLYPEEKIWARQCECMQTLLDKESRRWKYFETLTKASKIMTIAGMCGLEPEWRVETKAVTNKVPRRKAGITTGWEYEKQIVIEEGLDLRYVPMWALGVDRYQERTGRMRFFYEKYPCSRAEVMRRINAGLYQVNSRTVKVEDLKKRGGYGQSGNYLLSQLGMMPEWEEMDMCVLLRLWLPDSLRYVILLDGETVIHDEVVDEVRDYLIPIIPLIECDDPWPNSMLGVSALKGIEHLSYLIDDSLAYELRQQQQQLGQVWLYLDDAFPEVNSLYAGGGARIPVSWEFIKDKGIGIDQLQQLIQPIKTNPISNDSRYLREELERHWNEAQGMNQVSRGAEMPDSSRTKYEIQKMTEATDELFALKLKVMEVRGLEALARQAYNKIGRNMRDDLARKYLRDNFQFFGRRTPDDIPGGANVRLKAASLLAGHEKDQNARLADLQMLQKFGYQVQQIQPAVEVYLDNTMHWTEDDKEAIKKGLAPMERPPVPGMPGEGGPVPVNAGAPMIQANSTPAAEMIAAA